jgi:ATP-binding cassette, subfamily B, bacterial
MSWLQRILPRRQPTDPEVLRARAAAAQPLVEEKDKEEPYRPIEWPLVKRCMAFLRPYKSRYVLGISVCMVHVLLEMAGPKFTGLLIDHCVKHAGKVGEGFMNVLRSGAGLHAALLVGLWAACIVVSIILQRWVILIMTDAGERVQFDIRRALFAHLQTLSMSYYDRNKLGRIISRNTSDVEAMREMNVWGLNHVIQHLMMIFVAAVMLMITDWRLFLAVAWLAPIIYYSNGYFRRRVGATQQTIREGWTRVSTNLAENITGMRVVTAFNRQAPNLGTFNLLQEANTDNNVRGAKLNGIYQPSLELIRFVGRLIIFCFGAYLVVNGDIRGVGVVVTAFLYWDWFMNPIVFLGNFSNQVMAAMAGAERVFSLLDTRPDVMDAPQATPMPPIVGRVRFENVTFGYAPERPVLHDIEFEAQPGQMVALVGHTGSGKSSTISLIARFYQPQKGRVLIDATDIRLVTGDSLHRQVGLVLQVNYLFTGTVMENIRYGKPDATDEHIIAAATALGTHDTIMSLQKGYQTEVGERGASLSLGQRQLICFTRAFLANPRIFMLDEATSSVDTATEQLLQESLEKLLAGRTTFIVAHRLSTIMKADTILVFDQGRIVERGTHRELLLRGGKYAHLYEQFVQAVE